MLKLLQMRNAATVPLKSQIEAAFACVPYPGDDNLTAQGDDEGVSEYFRGTSWQGHAIPMLRYHSNALSYFTAEAFHYYLPTFLLAELEDPNEADVIAENVVSNFSPSLGSLWLKHRIALFSKPQLAAIAAFFEYYGHEYGQGGDVKEAKEYLSSLLAPQKDEAWSVRPADRAKEVFHLPGPIEPGWDH